MPQIYIRRPIFGLAIFFSTLLTVTLHTHPTWAQSTTIAPATTPVSTSTPDPAVIALQNTIATQTVQIEKLQRDLDYQTRDIHWWFLVAGALTAIIGLTSYQAYRGTVEKIRDRITTMVDAMVEKELNKFDITRVKIHLRLGRELDAVHERLGLSGLKNIAWYENLGRANQRGITVVPISSYQDEQEFQEFVKTTVNLDPTHAAFILYAHQYTVTGETIHLYKNLTLANTPTTVASAVLVVGRGLIL